MSDYVEQLVLQGQRASFREKTRTPVSHFQDDKSDDGIENYKNRLLDLLAKEEGNVENLPRNDDYNQYEMGYNSIGKFSDYNQSYTNSGIINETTDNKKVWFTGPDHLDKTRNDILENSLRKASLYSNRSAPRHLMQQKYENGSNISGKDLKNYPLLSLRSMETDYFPVTMGTAQQSISDTDAHDRREHIKKPKRKYFNVPHARPITSTTSPRLSRPNYSFLTTDFHSKARATEMFLATEAPVIASATPLAASPYQYDLAQLRMQQLRIEEERLLEFKRQEELERIRGPLPKWYEMKNMQFHREARKNNDLLHSKSEWQELMNYRSELVNASKKFTQASITN